MNPKLTAEEIRILRKEVNGVGNLAKSGFIVVTDRAREWIGKEDERIKHARVAGGQAGGILGKKYGKRGGPKMWKKTK